jgi:hypothetical protein
VVLYGCETWSLTVREEHKLRIFENRVLRRIFGPKRDGVTGGWRKLYNEELHNLYSSLSIIRIIKSRRMRWVVHVARMGEKRNVYRLLVAKPKGKRPLGNKTKYRNKIPLYNPKYLLKPGKNRAWNPTGVNFTTFALHNLYTGTPTNNKYPSSSYNIF